MPYARRLLARFTWQSCDCLHIQMGFQLIIDVPYQMQAVQEQSWRTTLEDGCFLVQSSEKLHQELCWLLMTRGRSCASLEPGRVFLFLVLFHNSTLEIYKLAVGLIHFQEQVMFGVCVTRSSTVKSLRSSCDISRVANLLETGYNAFPMKQTALCWPAFLPLGFISFCGNKGQRSRTAQHPPLN